MVTNGTKMVSAQDLREQPRALPYISLSQSNETGQICMYQVGNNIVKFTLSYSREIKSLSRVIDQGTRL